MNYRLSADPGIVSVGAPDEAGLDVLIEHHGSLHLFRPLTEGAKTWLEEHTSGTWFGGALVVEPRYSLDLAQGAFADGLCIASSLL